MWTQENYAQEIFLAKAEWTDAFLDVRLLSVQYLVHFVLNCYASWLTSKAITIEAVLPLLNLLLCSLAFYKFIHQTVANKLSGESFQMIQQVLFAQLMTV